MILSRKWEGTNCSKFVEACCKSSLDSSLVIPFSYFLGLLTIPIFDSIIVFRVNYRIVKYKPVNIELNSNAGK